MADDQALSSMYVELGLDTVKFEQGGATASKIADRTAGEIDKSFASISEGRGGLMLAEDAIGVRLPRHLNTLLAKIPGVSAAFSAILPIAGIAVAIEIITKLIEKHDALIAAAGKAAVATQNLIIKEGDHVKSLELEGLKLDDQIAKLEGRPKNNRLKEALLENIIAADTLASQFAVDFQKIDGEILESTTSMGAMKTELSLIADNPLSIIKGESPKEKVNKINDALKEVNAQVLLVNAAQVKMSESKGPADLAANTKEAANQMGFLKSTASAAMGVLHDEGLDTPELMGKLSQMTVLGANGFKALGIQADNALKKDVAGGLQDAIDAQTKRNALVEAQIEGNKKIMDSNVQKNMSEQLLALSGVQHTAAIDAQITGIHVAAMNAQYEIDKAAAVAHLNLLKSTTQQDKAVITAAMDALAAMETEHQSKLNDIHAAGNAKALHDQEETDRKQAEFSEKMGAESLRHAQEISKLELDEAKKSEDELVRTHQVTQKQDLANRLGFATTAHNIIVAGIAADRAAITGDAADQIVKKQALDNKLLEEEKKYEAEQLAIKEAALKKQETAVAQAQNAMAKSIADNVAKSIVQGKNLGDSMKKMGQQMLEEALSNAIRLIMIGKMQQIPQAGQAARAAFVAAFQGLPFPVNAIVAPIAAAGAFEGVMSLDQGGVIPHDALALVHKNEMVLPPHIASAIMQQSKGGAGGHTIHIDARGADAGVEQRIHRAMQTYENRAVSRSIAAVNDRAARRA